MSTSTARISFGKTFAFLIAAIAPNAGHADSAKFPVVTVPAQAGAVNGRSENSDAFMWHVFTQTVTPAPGNPALVEFETRASDEDTFTLKPAWPAAGAAKKLHQSLLLTVNNPHTPPALNCSPPGNPGVGGFPLTGTPAPCIAEETRRNRPQFDYIVKHDLYTQNGLLQAYGNKFKVDMPVSSVSVKADWVPAQTLVQWLPQLKNTDGVKSRYYTATVVENGQTTTYGLVSMHISSKQNPKWIWATFEHQLNPGRCDSIGCYDSFGAQKPVVPPDRSQANTQYGACAKTDALTSEMKNANLAPVWANYCLKSTQVDYTSADGTPNVLANSVIEGITANVNVASASCIACHAYASFGPGGIPRPQAKAMISYNPNGKPIPGILSGSQQFDFMWGVLIAPLGPRQ